MAVSMVLPLVFASPVPASEVSIEQFPKTVAVGQTANIAVTWKDFPGDQNYILRVQLQDSGADPPIFIFNDFEIVKPEGRLDVNLAVPYSVTASKSAKFVAAFISRTKGWDDVLTTADTGNVVEIVSDFSFKIDEYPSMVVAGETVKVKITWKGIRVSEKDYKLIVQLENWQANPQFAYVTRIEGFGPEGKAEANIKVPAHLPATKNCRFVAAFISREKNWQDMFTMTATPNEVEVVKFKPL